MDPEGRQAAGAFQWNRSGWFGGQIGATLWLLLLGSWLLVQSQPVGALLVGLGAGSNLVGVALWRRRSSLSPYLALQMLIAVCGIAAAVAMIFLRGVDVSPSSTELPRAWFLLFYPGLMLIFYLQEQSARKSSINE